MNEQLREQNTIFRVSFSGFVFHNRLIPEIKL